MIHSQKTAQASCLVRGRWPRHPSLAPIRASALVLSTWRFVGSYLKDHGT